MTVKNDGCCNVGLGALSLVTLVFQNATLVLMTRAASYPVKLYRTSTLVLNQEILKFIVCIFILAIERRIFSPTSLLRSVYAICTESRVFLLSVPAVCFTLQNFLLFISLEHLDVMTFQILSQSKLLFAALFSISLLRKSISLLQWIALLVLCSGVLLAQYDSIQGKAQKHHKDEANAKYLLGCVLCVLSGLSSSFAGVYFEKVVKTTAPSLAIRNIQLGLFGIPLCALYTAATDGLPLPEEEKSLGYFIWGLVAVHAGGGLLVAAVVKYADNILKGFATACAIIATGLWGAVFQDYHPSATFLVGCLLVTVSIIMYQIFEPKKTQSSSLQEAPRNI